MTADLDKHFLRSALARLQYRRLKPWVYKALWADQQVEHFVYFQQYGSSSEFLTADFGFRNVEVDEFAYEAIRTLGGALFRKVKRKPETDCFTRFSFERLHQPITSWYIFLPGLTPDQTVDCVVAEVRDRLLPVVRNWTSTSKLFSTLIADREPCPWVASNGAIRAAQVVALAATLQIDRRDVWNALQKRVSWISLGLSKGKNPISFISDLIAARFPPDH